MKDGTKVNENTLRVELLFKADNEVFICKNKNEKKELNSKSLLLSKLMLMKRNEQASIILAC